MPLVGLLWLSRKEKQRVALRYRGDKATRQVRFEIFRPRSESDVQPPIVGRFAATCPVCGYTTPYKRVREQLRARGGGTRDARAIAVITLKPDGSRGFRLATAQDVEVARRAAQALERPKAEQRGALTLVPDEPLPPDGALGFRVQKYNMTTWGDLFTPRQALALAAFARLVREAHQEALQETGDAGFARAVGTCLALAVSNMSPYTSASSIGLKEMMDLRSVFWGSAFPMHSDFVEANPLRQYLLGGIDYSLDLVAQVIEREGSQKPLSATVHHGSATALPLPDQSVPYVVTDPPYYDAVPYSDLSDFCYVWLKRMVSELHPDLFRWPLTPKAEEIIAYYVQPPDREQKNGLFFETKMQEALAECKRVLQPDGLAVVLFAHKGTAGWEALLNALIQAGWMVTSSWPIETERGARMRAKNSAVLASSVFLVCRPRPANAKVGDWRRVLEGLRTRVHDWLPRLAREGIEGADAIFSCIGPALEVYSQFERVETAAEAIPLADVKNDNGQVIKRGFLSFLWETIAREAMTTIAERYMEGADPSGFEEDARLTAMWLWTLRSRANGPPQAETEAEALVDEGEEGEAVSQKQPRGYALPYDDARLIIQGLGAHEESLKRPGGILEIKGEVARLVGVAERRRYLTGKEEKTAPPRRRSGSAQLPLEGMPAPQEEGEAIRLGATVLDRLHQAMLLFADGRSETLRQFLVDGGVGKDDRFWRLANALSALYPPTAQEKRWVDGILARKRGLAL